MGIADTTTGSPEAPESEGFVEGGTVLGARDLRPGGTQTPNSPVTWESALNLSPKP